METIKIEAQPRKVDVKNASKKAYRNNQIIGVIYKAEENTPVVLDRHDFEKLLPKIRSNSLLDIKINGQEKTTYIKDYSFFLSNHRIQHIDFQEIVPGKKIRISVPIEFTGLPVGVTKGGFTQIFNKSLWLKCDSQKIPPVIKIDISEMDVNDTIYIKNIDTLDGVTFLGSPDLAIISVLISSKKKSEAPAEAAAAAETAKAKEAKPAAAKPAEAKTDKK